MKRLRELVAVLRSREVLPSTKAALVLALLAFPFFVLGVLVLFLDHVRAAFGCEAFGWLLIALSKSIQRRWRP